jgi:hypothetical protein
LYTPDGVVAFGGEDKMCARCHFFVPGNDSTGEGDCHNIATSGVHMAQQGVMKMSNLCLRCSNNSNGCVFVASGDKTAIAYLGNKEAMKMCRRFSERVIMPRCSVGRDYIDSAIFG